MPPRPAATSRAQLDSTDVVLNINHRAWVTLATHADVASLRLAQPSPVPDTLLDPSVLAAARRDGQAEVIVLLRLPFRQASRSAREFKAMTDTYDEALNAVRLRLGLTSPLRAMPEFGLAGGVLKLSELESLFGRGDPRVMAVVANRPAAAPLLDTSIARMRMPLVWNHDAASYPESLYPDAGFRGAFPSVQGNPASPHVPIKIVIVDTGVFKAHPMTQGQIESFYESCFGTFSATRKSVCPGATESNPASWDTPGTPGSGEPPLSDTYGVNRFHPTFTNMCDHGTLVAAIAGGRQVAPATGGILTGVARSAKIVPVMAASWHRTGTEPPLFHTLDLLSALSFVVNSTIPGTTNNDTLVNLSVGNYETFSVPCSSGLDPVNNAVLNQHFANAVAELKVRGVPVIAAAGNNSDAQASTGVSWPACLPQVIKVGSLINNLDPNAHVIPALGTNLMPTTGPYANERFFLATGSAAVGVTGPRSARASLSAPYGEDFGTSFAAPHAAGAYAVVKAGYRKLGLVFDVDFASDYLRLTIGVNVPWTNPDNSADQRTYRSIRFDVVQ